jgi:hypothetical protein
MKRTNQCNLYSLRWLVMLALLLVVRALVLAAYQ